MTYTHANDLFRNEPEPSRAYTHIFASIIMNIKKTKTFWCVVSFNHGQSHWSCKTFAAMG